MSGKAIVTEFVMAIKLNLHPDRRMLRQFGLLCFAVFGAYGLWRWLDGTAPRVAVGLLAAAATGGLLGTLRPQWLRPVFVGWMILAFPVGWLVSHLLLGALYFAVFTPLGVLLRLLGKDALGLRRSTAASYWQKKPQQTDLRRYLRQY